MYICIIHMNINIHMNIYVYMYPATWWNIMHSVRYFQMFLFIKQQGGFKAAYGYCVHPLIYLCILLIYLCILLIYLFIKLCTGWIIMYIYSRMNQFWILLNQSKLDCFLFFHFPTELALNGIRFGYKTTGKVYLQSKFCLIIYQKMDFFFLCVRTFDYLFMHLIIRQIIMNINNMN